MNDEMFTMLSMSLRQLPARINVEQVEKLLGFTHDDITILMAEPKLELKPLGSPAPNAPKYFATVQILNLANKPDWLDRASNAIRRHHLQKRKRAAGTRTASETPSTKSSTETSTNDVGRPTTERRAVDGRTATIAACERPEAVLLSPSK
jgi:hypothetical protein